MVIGLTGGIASGKSLVSRSLMELGEKVVDADVIGREILAKDASARKRVEESFGEDVLKQGGEIDRGKLGDIIFRDSEKRRVLEAILHPLIRAEMWKKVRESSGDVILEVPLLIEKGEHERVDLVVLVYATREVVVQRLIARDGIGREEAIRKIDSQLPLEEKVSSADYIINNNGSVEETQEQVSRFHQVVRGKGTL